MVDQRAGGPRRGAPFRPGPWSGSSGSYMPGTGIPSGSRAAPGSTLGRYPCPAVAAYAPRKPHASSTSSLAAFSAFSARCRAERRPYNRSHILVSNRLLAKAAGTARYAFNWGLVVCKRRLDAGVPGPHAAEPVVWVAVGRRLPLLSVDQDLFGLWSHQGRDLTWRTGLPLRGMWGRDRPGPERGAESRVACRREFPGDAQRLWSGRLWPGERPGETGRSAAGISKQETDRASGWIQKAMKRGTVGIRPAISAAARCHPGPRHSQRPRWRAGGCRNGATPWRMSVPRRVRPVTA